MQDQTKLDTNWTAFACLLHYRDDAASKRSGLMYAVRFDLLPYFSYCKSFAPLANTNRFDSHYEIGKQICPIREI